MAKKGKMLLVRVRKKIKKSDVIEHIMSDCAKKDLTEDVTCGVCLSREGRRKTSRSRPGGGRFR